MTEAVILTVEARDPEDRDRAIAVLQRVFPAAMTFRTMQHERIAISVDDIRAEAPGVRVEDTDEAVMSFLLYTGPMDADCNEQYADMLYRIHRGLPQPGDHRALEDAGMRYVEPYGDGEGKDKDTAYLAVKRRHPAIVAAFEQTPWANDPFRRICRIAKSQEARLATRDGGVHRYTLIPMDVVSDLAPEVPY